MYVMTLHRSSIGKKIIMAVTGLIWVGLPVHTGAQCNWLAGHDAPVV